MGSACCVLDSQHCIGQVSSDVQKFSKIRESFLPLTRPLTSAHITMAPSKRGAPVASTSKSSPSKVKKLTKVEKKPKRPSAAATRNKNKEKPVAESASGNERKIVKISIVHCTS